MVVACLALFVALAGTSVAARHYLITSTKQIKPSVLKQLKGKKGPRGPQGPAGPTGATGAAGPAGTAGPAGASGATNVHIRYATGNIVSVSGATSDATASCDPGEVATGGGVSRSTSSSTKLVVSGENPTPAVFNGTPTGWWGQVTSTGPSENVQAQVWVVCASP
jgi:hypothetical protein